MDALSAQPAQPHASTLKAALGRCFSGPRQGCSSTVVPCRFLPLPHRQVWRTSTRCPQGPSALRWASWCSPCAGRGVRRRRRLPCSMWKSRRRVAPHGCLSGVPGYCRAKAGLRSRLVSRLSYTQHPGRAQGEAAAGVPARAPLLDGAVRGGGSARGVKPRRGARVCVLYTFRCAPFIMCSLFITRSMPVGKSKESEILLSCQKRRITVYTPWMRRSTVYE